MMDPRIDNWVATIGGAYHTLSTPATKEVVADTARGIAQVNGTPRHILRTGRYGITLGDTGMDVSSKLDSSPVLIESPTISPACGLSGSLQIGNK